MKGREKGFNDEKTFLIIKESAKGNSLHIIAEMFGRHVDKVRRFLKNPSQMKKRSDCGTSKIETATDLGNIIRKSGGKSGKTSKPIFTAAGLPHGLEISPWGQWLP